MFFALFLALECAEAMTRGRVIARLEAERADAPAFLRSGRARPHPLPPLWPCLPSQFHLLHHPVVDRVCLLLSGKALIHRCHK